MIGNDKKIILFPVASHFLFHFYEIAFPALAIPLTLSLNMSLKDVLALGFPMYLMCSVSLDEKISVISVSHQYDILLITFDSDKQAIMERIFDRQQKYLKTNSQLPPVSAPTKLSYHEHNQISEQSEFEIIQLPDLLTFLNPEKIINDYINIEQLFFSKNNIEQLDQSFDLIFDPNNPVLLVLLIPFAGFVLIYYENQQTKFYQIKQIITLSIIIILTTSAVITPL